MPLEGKVLERRRVPAAGHPHADGGEDVDGGDGRQDGGLDEPVHRHGPAPVRRPASEVRELDARAVGREAVGVVPQRRAVRVPHQLDTIGTEGVARQGVRLADDPGLQVEAQGPVLGCLEPELAPRGAERLGQEPARVGRRVGLADGGGRPGLGVVGGLRGRFGIGWGDPVARVVRRLRVCCLGRSRSTLAVAVLGRGGRADCRQRAQQKPDERHETVDHGAAADPQPSAPPYDAGSSGKVSAISSALLPPLPTATSRYCRPSWR